MIRSNLVKSINLLRQKRNFSSSDNLIYLPFGLTPIKYVKGMGVTLITIGGYAYYVGMTKEENKYKPYNTMINSVLFGSVVSLLWPITLPWCFLYASKNEICLLADRLDKEYEKKKKMEEDKK